MTSMNRIAQEIGVHRSTVMLRIDAGADPRKARSERAGKPKASGHGAPIDPVDEATIRNGIAQGLKTIEIARELGVSPQTVCRRAAKLGLDARRGRIEYAATLRRAVQDMRPIEALEYALNAYEELAGGLSERPMAEIGDVRLTKQQSQIFAILHNNIGIAVSLNGLLSVMTAGSPTSEASVASLRAQICHMRKKMVGRYTIETVYSGGYILEPVA